MNGDTWERWWSRISGVLLFAFLAYEYHRHPENDTLLIALVAVGLGLGGYLLRSFAPAPPSDDRERATYREFERQIGVQEDDRDES